MCGRFTLTNPAAELAERFEFDPAAEILDEYQPRYNVAPTQPVLAVLPGRDGRRVAVRMRWGLVPPWAKDLSRTPINARAETAGRQAMFRRPFRQQRCLIPADGFYEWQRAGGTRTPFRFTLRDGRPFAFAGLWESWQGPQGTWLSCCILTTVANALVAPVHDRMPVILKPEAESLWLDPGVSDPSAALAPYPAGAMAAYIVSPRVNNPRNDDAACVQPVA